MVFVYLGAINLLNYWYGMKARGLWIAAIAANAAMLVMCWVVGAHPEGLEWGLVGALVLAALLVARPPLLPTGVGRRGRLDRPGSRAAYARRNSSTRSAE